MFEYDFIIRIVIYGALSFASNYILRTMLSGLSEGELSRFQSITAGGLPTTLLNIFLLLLLIGFVVVIFFFPEYYFIVPVLISAYLLISIGRIIFLHLILSVFLPPLATAAYSLAAFLQLVGLAVLILPFWLNPLLSLF